MYNYLKCCNKDFREGFKKVNMSVSLPALNLGSAIRCFEITSIPENIEFACWFNFFKPSLTFPNTCREGIYYTRSIISTQLYIQTECQLACQEWKLTKQGSASHLSCTLVLFENTLKTLGHWVLHLNIPQVQTIFIFLKYRLS